MIFYLSGGMEYKKNLGSNWRDWLTGKLEERRHDAINPIKMEFDDNINGSIQKELTRLKLEGKLDDVRKIVRRSIFRKDMFGIQQADAIIVYYDEAVQKGAGTLSEVWESFREGLPIYLVTDFDLEDIPSWLIAETTDIFPDFEELLAYVKDHSLVVRDIMRAQQVRDEVLGGVYQGGGSN